MHNFVSFPFVFGLVLIVVIWMKDNIPRKVDLVWLKEGGGFIRSKHPTAGRFNAGEKLVFWCALGAGAAVSISGYLLLFPFYVTNIAGMQLAQVVHGIIAVLFIALIIAHIYIGTLGIEGAFEAMGSGSVDLNWAKEHHGLGLRRRSPRAEDTPCLLQSARQNERASVLVPPSLTISVRRPRTERSGLSGADNTTLNVAKSGHGPHG